MQDLLLIPRKQHSERGFYPAVDTLGTGYAASELSSLAYVKKTMLLGLTIAPTFAQAECVKNEHSVIDLKNIYSVVGSALKTDIYSTMPTLYIEDGVVCCDVRFDKAERIDITSTSETNGIAMDVFKGTQPLSGAAYNHLARLVRKSAKKTSSIPGML